MRNFLNTFRTVIKVAPRHYSAIDAEVLEDRILMSAMPMVDASLGIDESLSMAASPFPTITLDSASIIEHQAITAASTPVDSSLQTTEGNKDVATVAKRLELVFVNANTPNYQGLLDDLLANADSDRDFEVYLLDANRDGIEQISAILDGYSNVDAIHLVSHGESGAIQLGQTWLNRDNLSAYAGQLANWQSSFAVDADILIYGCDLASHSAGRDLIEAINALTGADVAASIDDTGHSQWGANWSLEYHIGVIESKVAFSEAGQQAWQGKLATITVTTFSDVVNSGDGVLSLREAIIQSNGGSGGDTIVLSAGTYTLTIAGQNENLSLTGDLDVTKSVTIVGLGVGFTRIDGSGLDRVFDLQSGTVAMSAIRIQGGTLASNDWGAGILVDNDVTLNLSQVEIAGSSAGTGAGIYNKGILTAVDSLFTNNTATNWGGGLYNDRGNVSLERVTISGNSAGADGGGINNAGSGAILSLANTTISSNTAGNNGGGLWTNRTVTATNVTVAFNSAAAGDGLYGQGGSGMVSLKNSLLHNPLGSNSNSAMISLGHNLDSDGSLGLTDPTDINNINPLLGSLQNNGGATLTHALSAGSAAINSGTATGAPITDQRNVNRDTNPDIGAFEFTLSTLIPASSVQLNATSSGLQSTSGAARGSQQAVAVDNSGNYVVTWSSQNQDGSGWGVYVRRFSSAGIALTGEVLVNSATINDQQWSRVASDAIGNFVVTWTSSNQDGTPLSVYARRFASDGTALSGEFLVHTTSTGDQSNSSIAMDSAGNFIIAWQGAGPGDTDGIFARRFTANGIAIDANEFIINTDTTQSHLNPTVTMNDSGAFAVAWDNNGGARARMFNASRTPITGEITLDSTSTAGEASIVMHSDGTIATVWRDTITIFGYGVQLRRYDAAGTAIGGAASVVNSSISGDQTAPSIAMDSSGNFIVVWEGNGTIPGESDSAGVFGQKYNATGTKVGGEFLINSNTTGTQNQASVSMIDLNNFVAVWSGQGPSDTDGVYARLFGASNVAPAITSNGGGVNATISVNENTSLVTTVIATDTDVPAQTLTYSIFGGVDAARFTINGANGQLSFIVLPNYESPTDSGGNNVYHVIVQVSDGSLTDTQTILVTIVDANEFATGAVSDSNSATNTVNENSATGTLVGITASATDADATNNTITYSLRQTAGGRFRINSTTGVVSVDTGTLLNRELASSHLITVRAASSDGSFTDQNFTININDVDEFDVGPISDSNNALNFVNETAVNGATVGITAFATDADATTKTIIYSLDDTAAGRFAIDSTSGIVTVANASLLDFESNAQHAITVRATSQDGSFSTRTLTILVDNSNDNAPLITSSNTHSISENQTFVVQLTATDADLPAQGLTFSIVGGPDDIGFEITLANQLVFRRPPNFENPRDANFDNVYSVAVRVSDGAGGTDTQLIFVTVNNVNEAPAVLSPSYSLLQTDILTSEPGGVLAGAIDPEGDPLSVSLVSTTGNGLLTFASDGSFTYTPGTDFLGIDSFTFEVSDGVGGVTQGTVSLVVSPGFIPPTPELPQGTTIHDSGSTDGGESSSESPAQERRSNSSQSGSNEGASSDSGPPGTTPAMTAQFQTPVSESTAPHTDRKTTSVTANSNEFSSSATAHRSERGATAVRLADVSVEYRIIREFARQASVRAAEQVALATIQRIDLVLHDGLLWNDLNHLREQISTVSDVTPITLGTATGVASGLSVGYVMWLLRGGYIVAGVMAQLPAWGLIDPLPILSQLDNLDDDDDDSLASMVDKSNSDHDSKIEDEKNNPSLLTENAKQSN